jgi:integrase
MLARLVDYSRNVHVLSQADDWFFPGFGGKPMTRGNVEKNLRKFLWQARISHGGRGKGPRVHDFRHSHSVHCLRRWVLEGKNLYAYLPVLQAYLGHVSLADTAYYLHLTADLFPDITAKVESAFAYIIPKEGDSSEND